MNTLVYGYACVALTAWVVSALVNPLIIVDSPIEIEKRDQVVNQWCKELGGDSFQYDNVLTTKYANCYKKYSYAEGEALVKYETIESLMTRQKVK